MHEFSVIASSGHCGTRWLAWVMNQPGAPWYHELRTKLSGLAWQDAYTLPVNSSMFESYWLRVREELSFGPLGDANSWEPLRLPEVCKVQPISRVIYLIRHGIQQLHSLATHSPVWSRAEWPKSAQERLERLAGIAGLPYRAMNRLERLCLLVKANTFMPDWLRAQGLRVEVYTLEQLTINPAALAALAGIPLDAARALQRYDMNRKVTGSREPRHLWGIWPQALRDAYEAVCGEVVL